MNDLIGIFLTILIGCLLSSRMVSDKKWQENDARQLLWSDDFEYEGLPDPQKMVVDYVRV
jgi:hypothetical protein